MKTALITTTIHVPRVLALYRKLGPDVQFFVAVDKKTPNAAMEFLHDLPNTQICQGDHYACSDLIGWDNDSRRNIALLEAVKWGADIIFSTDDDMIPLGLDFFERFEIMLSEPYSGMELGAPGKWCDVGRLTLEVASQRGLPLCIPTDNSGSFVHDVQIGAMQGIILGAPDTDAETNMRKRPFIHSVTDILRNGFVIDPLSCAVFNSQITAFRRELAPCFAQFYNWQGRNTDIFASLVMRRVMRERGFHTYFGPPAGFHNRTPAVRASDLANEKWGVNNVEKFQACLEATMLLPGPVSHQVQHLYDSLAAAGHLPLGMAICVNAFLDDMEKVL